MTVPHVIAKGASLEAIVCHVATLLAMTIPRVIAKGASLEAIVCHASLAMTVGEANKKGLRFAKSFFSG